MKRRYTVVHGRAVQTTEIRRRLQHTIFSSLFAPLRNDDESLQKFKKRLIENLEKEFSR